MHSLSAVPSPCELSIKRSVQQMLSLFIAMTDDRVKLHYCCINMRSLLLPGPLPMTGDQSPTHLRTSK